MPFLSDLDVHSLVRDPSAENRERTAVQISEVFKSRALNGKAASLAEEIIRIFAHDAAVRVRQALAEQLKHDPDLPRDVALSLAHDVDDVAIPILRFSDVLADTDLANIVANKGPEKQRAIAGRLELSVALSDLLLDQGDAETVATLLANGGSSPSEGGLLATIERFGDNDHVQLPLSHRHVLPHAVVARMVTIVSNQVLKALASRPDLPNDLAADIVEQAEERAFLTLSREDGGPEDVVKRLAELGRLTPNLAMRALIGGDIDFFELTIAKLAKMQLNAVKTLAYDAGALGARELCRRIGAPAELAAVLEAGLATYSSIRAEDGLLDRERFQARMIERMLSCFDRFGENLESGEVDVLIGRLRAVR